MHRLQGDADMGRGRPVRPRLAIGAGIAAGTPGGARDRDIGLGIDRIPGGFAPLRRPGQHQLDRLGGMKGHGRLEVDDVHIAGIASQCDVIAIGKQGVEGF
jgi:hypothetical protein